jgi:hypothetical protein
MIKLKSASLSPEFRYLLQYRRKFGESCRIQRSGRYLFLDEGL